MRAYDRLNPDIRYKGDRFEYDLTRGIIIRNNRIFPILKIEEAEPIKAICQSDTYKWEECIPCWIMYYRNERRELIAVYTCGEETGVWLE